MTSTSKLLNLIFITQVDKSRKLNWSSLVHLVQFSNLIAYFENAGLLAWLHPVVTFEIATVCWSPCWCVVGCQGVFENLG